ncbi:MAG TPA: flagellar basal body rod C-terminal domain-containing protein, partial [Bacillota bacterium]
LDLALEGPGFFVVQTPAGPAYTRSGDFRLDADGRLVTAEGFAVLGERGEIILPSPEVTVAPDGTIFAGDDELGRLRLVTFVAPEFLERSGSGTFTATAASGPPVPDGATRVHQGFLEGANGSVVSLAVELLASLRAYEASQQAVRLQSEALRLASTELGRIG